jgi:hypothetical protein
MTSQHPILEAHDKKVVFSLPHLDKKIEQQASEHFANEATASPIDVSATPVPSAGTLGWDTVFAIRVPDVNAAIVEEKTSPKTFASGDLGGGWSITGDFGDWQITPGGDGENINLLIPATSGIMVFSGKTYALDGAQITAQYKLELMPGNPPPNTPPTKEGSNHKFKPSTQAESSHINVVSVIDVTIPKATKDRWPTGMPAAAVEALVEGAFGKDLNANVSDFTHTFAAVDLNVMADHGSLQWLKPAFTSYAYADGHDLCSSFFGVLTLTDNIERAANLMHELSPAAIPTTQRSAFLISEQLFMRQAILPNLPNAFKSASSSDFKLTNNGTEVINATTDKVELDGVKYGAITYHPYLESFDLVINTTELVTTMTVKIDISPGITTYVDISTYHGLELEKKTNGKQTIGYTTTRPYQATHRVHTAPGVIVTEVVAGLIVAVVGVVIAAVVDNLLTAIIVGVIAAILGAVIAAIQIILTDVIAKGVAEAMPDIDPLIQAGTHPITWPTQVSDFTITQVGLNRSIQLSGDPGFSGPDTCNT